MKKRLLSLFFFSSFFFSSGVYAAPRWDVAALTWAATAIVVDAMTLGTATPLMVAGAAALGFHAGVIGIYWDELATNPVPATQTITVNLDPNVPLVTPPNYTTGTLATNGEPVMNKNASSPVLWNGTSYANIGELLTTALDPAGAGEYQVTSYEPVITVLYHDFDPMIPDSTFTVSYDPMKPSDGRCEINKVNGTFVAGANDPDCSGVPVTGLGSSKINLQSGTSAVELEATTAGGTAVRAANYDATTRKTTAVTTGFDAAGNLTDQIQEYLNGIVLGSGTTGTSGTTTTGSCGGVDQPACKIDVGEVPAGAGVTPDVSTAYTASSIFNIFTSNDKLNALKGFSLPAHSSVCPQPSFVWWDKTFTISAHCQLFNDHMPIFSGVMSLIWVITGTFIILRA